ncbi:MAG: DegT/DnrJ/EryC1/StrS family aminotransferase [Pseudomonadales bacterium]
MKPVFIDIDKSPTSIDVIWIGAAITENTSAILPDHVYGIPCQADAIEEIADKYSLKVVYDAAHAFGDEENGQSILNHGDFSVLSFHATKAYSTLEGGAIICKTAQMKRKIDEMVNFGFVNGEDVSQVGTNAKMNEVSAAFGLLQLKYMDVIISSRKAITAVYESAVDQTAGLKLVKTPKGVKGNYSNVPVMVEENSPLSRDELFRLMEENGIYCRKYFSPNINQYSVYDNMRYFKPGELPVAESIRQKTLCLPIYPDLEDSDLERITGLLKYQKAG